MSGVNREGAESRMMPAVASSILKGTAAGIGRFVPRGGLPTILVNISSSCCAKVRSIVPKKMNPALLLATPHVVVKSNCSHIVQSQVVAA